MFGTKPHRPAWNPFLGCVYGKLPTFLPRHHESQERLECFKCDVLSGTFSDVLQQQMVSAKLMSCSIALGGAKKIG